MGWIRVSGQHTATLDRGVVTYYVSWTTKPLCQMASYPSEGAVGESGGGPGLGIVLLQNIIERNSAQLGGSRSQLISVAGTAFRTSLPRGQSQSGRSSEQALPSASHRLVSPITEKHDLLVLHRGYVGPSGSGPFLAQNPRSRMLGVFSLKAAQ